MIKIPIPILVEGKYDKIRLSTVVDAQILTTDGFGIFKKDEFARYLRRIASERGLIVLTDSDGAGLVIRNHLRDILPPEKIIHLYTPRIAGKEKRKSAPSKEGILGVEGMDRAWIEQTLAPFAEGESAAPRGELHLTKTDFYEQGLSGGTKSAVRRRALCRALDLPETLSAKALLEALNLLVSREEWETALSNIKKEPIK